MKERMNELVRRRDLLLREKVTYSTLFSDLRKEKDRLEIANRRLLEEEKMYKQKLHDIEKEHL
jgi:hypothetical protein